MITFEVATTKSAAKEQAVNTRHWLDTFIANLPAEATLDVNESPSRDTIDAACVHMADISHLTRLAPDKQGCMAAYLPPYATYCTSWGAHWDTACADMTGQIFNEGLAKLCNAISRFVHLSKSVGDALGQELGALDWSKAAERMVSSYIADAHTITLHGTKWARFFKDGEVFIGGFFTEQDRRRLRYSHKRLGAYLASTGATDEEVRALVEQQKMRAAGSHFVVYPNDRMWGDLYVQASDNVGSCMSNDAAYYDSFEIFGDTHPVDVYSSAAFGRGDNGLALVVSKSDDEITGRGILNTANGDIVRWYGDHIALRSLHKVGIGVSYDALRGSWLALVQDGEVVLHPYVDGNYCYGCVDKAHRRIHLSDDCGAEGIELQDTTGMSCAGGRVWSEALSRDIPRARAVYLSNQDDWMEADTLDDYEECHIWGEPCISGQYTVRLISAADYYLIGTENDDGDEITLDDVDYDEVTICGDVYRRLFSNRCIERGCSGTVIEGEDVIYY